MNIKDNLMDKENIALAALFAILSSAAFAVMCALGKIAQESVPQEMVLFFRFLIGFIVIFPFIFFDKKHQLKTQHLSLHFFRATCSFLILACTFYALKYITLTSAILLNITYPLFVPLLMYILYKKKISYAMQFSILLGFVGVIFVLQPKENDLLHLPSFIGLAAGFFASVSIILVKKLSAYDTSRQIVFYYSLISAVIALIFVLPHWQTPSPKIFLILIEMGIAGTVYQQALTYALKLANSTVVSPVMYSSVIFGGIIDWYFWSIAPNTFTLLGTVLLILGSLTTVYLGNKKSIGS